MHAVFAVLGSYWRASRSCVSGNIVFPHLLLNLAEIELLTKTAQFVSVPDTYCNVQALNSFYFVLLYIYCAEAAYWYKI